MTERGRMRKEHRQGQLGKPDHKSKDAGSDNILLKQNQESGRSGRDMELEELKLKKCRMKNQRVPVYYDKCLADISGPG